MALMEAWDMQVCQEGVRRASVTQGWGGALAPGKGADGPRSTEVSK